MRPKLIAVLGLCLVAACNTVAGAGQDLRTAGSAIETQARESQSDM